MLQHIFYKSRQLVLFNYPIAVEIELIVQSVECFLFEDVVLFKVGHIIFHELFDLVSLQNTSLVEVVRIPDLIDDALDALIFVRSPVRRENFRPEVGQLAFNSRRHKVSDAHLEAGLVFELVEVQYHLRVAGNFVRALFFRPASETWQGLRAPQVEVEQTVYVLFVLLIEVMTRN